MSLIQDTIDTTCVMHNEHVFNKGFAYDRCSIDQYRYAILAGFGFRLAGSKCTLKGVKKYTFKSACYVFKLDNMSVTS